MRFSSAFLPVCLILLAGCAPGNFASLQTSTSSPVASPTPAPPSPIQPALPTPVYHAYGDSITYGYTLPDPSTQAYPVLVGQAKSLSTQNRAHSGDLACDIAGYAIFPNHEDPSLAAPIHASVLIGTNDVDYFSTGLHERDFNLCQQATIAWLALPSDFKLLTSAPGVTTSGPGALTSADALTTWTTNDANASISFPIQLSTASSLYVWYRIAFGNPGLFTYTLDQTSGPILPSGSWTPQVTSHGFTSALAFLRIPSVPAGTHTLTLTQVSPGLAGMGILAAGFTPPPAQQGLSRVLVGTIPQQWAAPPGGACIQNDAPCQQYTADITANVALFATDGLDVHLFDSRKYSTGTAADMNDSLHPNVLGQQEIAHALQDAF